MLSMSWTEHMPRGIIVKGKKPSAQSCVVRPPRQQGLIIPRWSSFMDRLPALVSGETPHSS